MLLSMKRVKTFRVQSNITLFTITTFLCTTYSTTSLSSARLQKMIDTIGAQVSWNSFVQLLWTSDHQPSHMRTVGLVLLKVQHAWIHLTGTQTVTWL